MVLEVLAAHDPLAVQVVHGEAVQQVLGRGSRGRRRRRSARRREGRAVIIGRSLQRVEVGRRRRPVQIGRGPRRGPRGRRPSPRSSASVSCVPSAVAGGGQPGDQAVGEQRAVEGDDPGQGAGDVDVDRLAERDRSTGSPGRSAPTSTASASSRRGTSSTTMATGTTVAGVGGVLDAGVTSSCCWSRNSRAVLLGGGEEQVGEGPQPGERRDRGVGLGVRRASASSQPAGARLGDPRQGRRAPAAAARPAARCAEGK